MGHGDCACGGLGFVAYVELVECDGLLAELHDHVVIKHLVAYVIWHGGCVAKFDDVVHQPNYNAEPLVTLKFESVDLWWGDAVFNCV